MPKATKKKAAKKRGGKQGPKNKPQLPKEYAALSISNPLVEPFTIETNPPYVGRGDSFAWELFKARVEATLPKMKPGQAFNINEQHSKAWIRTQLNTHFPQHQFLIVPIPDNENAYRIYLKA